jgi:predicted ATPase
VPLDPAVRFGPYVLDPGQGLRRGRAEVRLTPKALAVLRVLASRPGQVVTKDELFRLAWPDTAVSDAALASCIQELRRALRDDARRPRYIETVHRRGYRFLVEGPVAGVGAGRAAAPGARTVTPFGRDAELATLRDALARARAGDRRAVFVSGEAGIGKTTLVQAFLSGAAGQAPLRVLWGQCVEHYGPGEAYQPLLEGLTRLGRGPGGEAVTGALARCAPSWLAQLPSLTSPSQLSLLQRRTAGTTSERMLRELTDAVEAIARDVPLVLVLEDLHWADLSTLDWVASFARRPEGARVLVAGTYRAPAPAAAGRGAADVAHELRLQQAAIEVTLARLDAPAVGRLVAARHPAAPSSEAALRGLAEAVHRHTEGNPLFVAAVLGDLQARGLLVPRAGAWHVEETAEAQLKIPDDVRRLIERQLEGLPDAGRRVVEVASVAGVEFTAAAVAAGAGVAVSDAEAVLGELARRERLVRASGTAEWPDGTLAARFAFLHSLYREVAYERIAPASRAALHRAVAAREEAGFGDRAPEIAAELAMHFARGREPLRAGPYLQQAAAAAARRGAYPEALAHVRNGLALLEAAPAGAARDAQEAGLRILLGGLLMATGGWSATGVEEAYERARVLCERGGDPGRLFASVWGEWLYRWGRAEHARARADADRLLALAESGTDAGLVLQACHAQWATAFSMGDLAAADAHCARGIGLYDPGRHGPMAESFGGHDAGVCALSFRACALALLGRREEAARVAQDGVALARTLDHPFSLALALFFASLAQELRGDPEAAQALAEDAAAIARDQGLRLLRAWSTTLAGWAVAVRGDPARGLVLMRDGLAGAEDTGARQLRPHMLGLLAEAYVAAGSRDEARAIVDEALATVARTGEAFGEGALRRLEAELAPPGPGSTRSGTG